MQNEGCVNDKVCAGERGCGGEFLLTNTKLILNSFRLKTFTDFAVGKQLHRAMNLCGMKVWRTREDNVCAGERGCRRDFILQTRN